MAILVFGGNFGKFLLFFGGNFGKNCLFLQCNNERQSLRGDNKAKGYHCAKIIM